MVSRKIERDLITMSALLDGFVENGAVARSRSLFDKMVQHNVKANEVPYNKLIKGYCKVLRSRLVF